MAAVWRPCCKRVLIIEDEEMLADNVAIYLKAGGAEVAIANSGEQALAYLEDFSPQCVIADFNLPGMNGIESMRRVREQFPDTFCILVTGQGSEAVYMAARASGVDHILIKPFSLPDLGKCLCTHRQREALGGTATGTEVQARA